MFKIHYETSGGVHKLIAAPSYESMATKLESLWQARIKARAEDSDGRKVGAVETHPEGHLTWWCEGE